MDDPAEGDEVERALGARPEPARGGGGSGGGARGGGGIDSSDVVGLAKRFEQVVRADRSGTFAPQLQAVVKSPKENKHFSVVVDAKVLLEEDVVLGHLVLREPVKMLHLFANVLVLEQERFLAEAAAAATTTTTTTTGGAVPASWTVKPNVHARVKWLPSTCRKPNVSSIRAHDVGLFIQFGGTVVRTGQLKVLEAERVFKCNNPRCGAPVRVTAAVNEVGSIIRHPSGPCQHCKKSASYTEDVSARVCHDYQEVRVQENVQKLGMGSIPRAITVLLLHDLVDSCKAGDDVVVTGYPFHRWGPTYKDERCSLDTVVMANYVHVGGSGAVASSVGASASSSSAAAAAPPSPENDENSNEQQQREAGRRRHARGGGGGGGRNRGSEADMAQEVARFWGEHAERPLAGRDILVASVCPQLHELYVVKLAVLLTLAGSPPTYDPITNQRVRGEPHLLLVGDPGTGKSQFLRFASKIVNRSVLTTGIGTTSAGLTCATVKDQGEFMLEAGALVLADRGLCCIDEFGSIREHDRATIHEAMEQQSLSIAKAGLVTQLNTRTTIIAATNPKGQYDVDADASANTGIAAPLLSRFDLVLVLLDRPDLHWDKTVSEFVLQGHMVVPSESGGGGGGGGGDVEDNGDDEEGDEESRKRARTSASAPSTTATRAPALDKYLPADRLGAYLSHVKRTVDPVLTSDAGLVLRTYYASQRRAETSAESGRTTLRFLESLIRLSKAHARIMNRDTVLVADAVVAVALMETSVNGATGGSLGVGLGDAGGTLHSSFPMDPDAKFAMIASDVLARLGLARLDRPGIPRGEWWMSPSALAARHFPHHANRGVVDRDGGDGGDDDEDARVSVWSSGGAFASASASASMPASQQQQQHHHHHHHTVAVMEGDVDLLNDDDDDD